MIRITRGWVVVREEKRRSSVIIDPGVASPREIVTHRGVVLAMGNPAILHGTLADHETPADHEVPHGFVVGDMVQFHFAGHEGGRTHEWEDGKPAVWLAQHEIDAVIEGDSDGRR